MLDWASAMVEYIRDRICDQGDMVEQQQADKGLLWIQGSVLLSL